MEVEEVTKAAVAAPSEDKDTKEKKWGTFKSTTMYGGKLVINDPEPKEKFPRTHQFSITYLGEDGQSLEGNFIVKRMTLGEQAAVGVTKAGFNGNMNVDGSTDSINGMIAYLKHALVDKPDWFKPLDLFDAELPASIYGRCLVFEEFFRR